MLTKENLNELARRFQTLEKNVIREYIQHLFLSSLYKISSSEKLLFKGGTALKIIYGSPRFSEDLNFTGQNIRQIKIIDNLFLETIAAIERVGINISLKEAKKTSGGYLGLISYKAYGNIDEIAFEVSLRKSKVKKEVTTIVSDFMPSYLLIQLPATEIVKEKINALLQRKKPRDYYDFYFILRHPDLHRHLDKKALLKVKDSLKKNKINFKKELSILLPASHHIILKDFKNILVSEIGKYVG